MAIDRVRVRVGARVRVRGWHLVERGRALREEGC